MHWHNKPLPLTHVRIFLLKAAVRVIIGSQQGRNSAAALSMATSKPIGCFPAAEGVPAAFGSKAMIGFFAALVAIYFGARGPAFRWKGALLLGLAAVAIGTIATAFTAREARAQGLHFAVTPGSVAAGLILQACFMLTFYTLAWLAQWSARQLVSNRIVASQAKD